MNAHLTDLGTLTAYFPRKPPEPDRVHARIALWLDRQRQRLHLSRLDSHLLDDIGVSREAAEAESRRWD